MVAGLGKDIATNIGLWPEAFTPGNFADGWSRFDVSFGRFFVNSAMVAGLTDHIWSLPEWLKFPTVQRA